MFFTTACSEGHNLFCYVHFSALEKLRPVHLMAIEVRSVHTSKTRDRSDRDTAHPAHSRAVDHDRVETHDRRNALRTGDIGPSHEKKGATVDNDAMDRFFSRFDDLRQSS